MKRWKKYVSLLLFMIVLAMVPVLQSSAASAKIGDVKRLKAKTTSETTVKLSWSKVGKAKGYYVYRVDTKTGKKKKIATTSANSYTVKKLSVNQKYSWQVYAYRKDKKKTYVSQKGSPVASATTYILKPGVPPKFRQDRTGDLSATLAWSKGSNASGYYLYLYNETKKEFVKLATVSGTKYELKNLKEGEKYRFKIQSYRKVGKVLRVGDMSGQVTVTGKKLSKAAKSVHGRYFSATVKSKTKATVVGTGKTKTIKKGTKLSTISKGNGTVTAIMSNGTKIKISGKKLNYGNLKLNTKTYSRKVKEAFVNERGYSSPTKYLIWISQYTANTTIFKGSKGKWKMVRSMPCVVGRYGNTPTGVYKLVRRGWQYGDVVWYFTWNKKLGIGNAFHIYVDWHKQGAYSGGCIRLAATDLHYLDRYCKMGTTVISY